MAGPYPPHHGTGPVGPPPGPPRGPGSFPVPGYPGMLPPPVFYPRRRRRRLVVGLALLTAAVAALAGVLGYALHGGGGAGGAGHGTGHAGTGLTEAPAKTAIQGYLNALLDRDIETIARNSLCGIYDQVTDHQADNAVAKLSSDAFRKQFLQAEVTSVDKIVYLSDFQAQALFTMRVERPAGGQRDSTQGVAQLLSTGGHLLVCSYQPRGAGSF